MFDKKFDQSLLDKITKVMNVNNSIDTYTKQLNESIGIYDKKELPSELHESYDSVLNSLISGEENPPEIESLKEAVSKPHINMYDQGIQQIKKKKAAKEYDVDTERKLADKDTEYGVDTERDLAKKEQPKKARYMEEESDKINETKPQKKGKLVLKQDKVNTKKMDKIGEKIAAIRAKAKKG